MSCCLEKRPRFQVRGSQTVAGGRNAERKEGRKIRKGGGRIGLRRNRPSSAKRPTKKTRGGGSWGNVSKREEGRVEKRSAPQLKNNGLTKAKEKPGSTFFSHLLGEEKTRLEARKRRILGLGER